MGFVLYKIRKKNLVKKRGKNEKQNRNKTCISNIAGRALLPF
jgi:hypothetical protein